MWFPEKRKESVRSEEESVDASDSDDGKNKKKKKKKHKKEKKQKHTEVKEELELVLLNNVQVVPDNIGHRKQLSSPEYLQL